jgi:hypothetical protein
VRVSRLVSYSRLQYSPEKISIDNNLPATP